ncbi:cuticle protein 7 [Procambarus clarkii]|uniref:cuticle protein 7 n=1 Tax=Procambarus clarkii TaxID=6728 RepID=UPI001E6727FB|nr:cuticle protein 21-like [Procambarus clarkii]
MFKVACAVMVVGIVGGMPRPDGPPIYGPPSYPAPHPQSLYKEEPKPYAFDYGVQDTYTGANFGHTENSDGKAVKGSYSVALPDGRVQTVNYVADHVNGFQAEVTYEGQAVYPEHKPGYNKPAPNVYPQPAPPVYPQPAPVYPQPSPSPYA